jgi:chorismate lyase
MGSYWRIRGRQPPDLLREWLFLRGSLTQRLRETCPQHFHVKVLRQYWAKPLVDEAQALNLSLFSYVRIREVQLCCEKHPKVFARTIMPHSSLQGALRHLLKLGTQPLGEILFTQHAQRINAQICQLHSNHRLFQLAVMYSKQNPHELWMRRSIFLLKNQPLLVQEIFYDV